MPPQQRCSKCGSDRNRVTGQLTTPDGVVLTCKACGYSWPCAPPRVALLPKDVDRRRIERLVREVIASSERSRTFVSVTDGAEGWDVTVRADRSRIIRCHVTPGSLNAMKRIIATA